MKKELTEEQIEDKKIIKERRTDIAITKLFNIGYGMVIGVASLGLVAGSLLGITGTTLFTVGQHKRDTALATYMASEDFQVKKAEKLNRKENLESVIKQLQEYQKQGYYSEEVFTKLKQQLEEIDNESDYDYAKRILLEDENNEFHGVVKNSTVMYGIGGGLMAGSGAVFLIKGLHSITSGLAEDNWKGAWGQDLLDVIGYAAGNIKDDNLDIARDKEEIKELKNKRKESEESNDDSKEEE